MESLNLEEPLKLKFELTNEELEDVKQFLKVAKTASLDIKDEEMAIKFLRAKRFHIDLALELFQKHEEIRNKEHLLEVNPFDSEIFTELLSQKFTFLMEPDNKSGASVCIFTAKLHYPQQTSYQNVLKGLIFQLDAILKSSTAQKNGLIFVYNMTGSLYSNFDMSLSLKILNLLKGAYPARVCKIIIFTPPLWFRAAFNFLRLFVKDKLQDRVWILTKSEDLYCHLSKEILPISLGGYAQDNHILWLKKAFSSMGYANDIFNRTENFPDNCLSQLNVSQSINGENVPNNSFTEPNNLFENGHFGESEIAESVVSSSPNTNCSLNELLSKTDESLISSAPSGDIHNLVTPDSLGITSFDIPSSPTVEIVQKKPIKSNPSHCSPTSTSSGIGSCFLDNKESDYEMLSISSWDLNLITSFDEDVIEEDNHGEKTEDHDENSPKTIENSPNVQCSSARTPFKILDKPMFFQKVQLKRRNAVREEIKVLEKKPSWAFHRPEPSISLHNALSPDSDDEKEGGVTIDFFIESEKHSFYATLNEFRNDSIYGDMPQFTSYSCLLNIPKNRYSDIPCIESSRVKLIRDINWNGIVNEEETLALRPTDYIHANWVDGYRQINAYICTQGPLSTTASDFWHMIIQYRVPIIVMTTRPKEQNREKCSQYWPEIIKEKKIISGLNNSFDSFEITCLRSKEFGPNCPSEGVCDNPSSHWYRVTLLHIKNLRTGQEHRVNHFYFHSWPDQGIPNSSEGFLHFILQIRQTYRLNIAKLGYESEMDQKVPPPAIVVHCSAGIGRTGTFIVTEICTKSLSDCGRFNLHQTMLKLRSQRYKCVQNAYQYLFCRNAIIDYAKHIGYLGNQIINCEEEEIEESEPELDQEMSDSE